MTPEKLIERAKVYVIIGTDGAEVNLGEEIERLREALALVRVDICTGPVNDTLWRQAEPNETTVDFICSTLHDDWDYDKWLAEQIKGPE